MRPPLFPPARFGRIFLAVVGYPSGQRGQTVNLLAYAFSGSNPEPTTTFPRHPLPVRLASKSLPLLEIRATSRLLFGNEQFRLGESSGELGSVTI